MRILSDNIPDALGENKVTLESCLREFARVRPVDRVLLFGSYARGEQRPESDVDLCIIAEGAERQLKAARDFRTSIRDIRPKPALTLLPITPARWSEKMAGHDDFFETVRKEGICVAEKD